MIVEEEDTDVLQNIEFAIISVYRADSTLLDSQVTGAVKALIRHYMAEERGRAASPAHLGERTQRIFDSVKSTCEWRLGRKQNADPGELPDAQVEPISIDVILACLRRIRESIRFWTKEAGRQGYLDFVNQALP